MTAMVVYPALIHKDPDSSYGVTFPDFPGCVSAGDTIEEARRMAEEALELHLEGMIEDGERIPDPSSLDEIAADPANAGIRAIIMVPAQIKSKAVRINITIPEDFLSDVDRYAEEHGLTRSGFLVKAARDAINKNA
jgi:predicted RNase H-like HicB family nuclease